MPRYFIAYTVTSPGGMHDHTSYRNTVIERASPISSEKDISSIEEHIFSGICMNSGVQVTILSFQRMESSITDIKVS